MNLDAKIRMALKPLSGAAAAVALASVAHAAPVDLHAWTAESYPAVSGFGAGVWTVSSDGSSVHQSVNGQPTLFMSDFGAIGTEVRGRIVSHGGGDDDFIGFALGYNPGDTGNAAADYLLLDWKKATQFYDFGTPSSTPGSTALVGLALSRVSGTPTADEFWGHWNDGAQPSGLQELARGATLGSTGWVNETSYEFRFVFQPNSLQVYVDDTLQISVAGSFSAGRMAFYNFSQADVTYSAFDVTSVPEPATWALSLAGLAAVGALARRGRVSKVDIRPVSS